MTDPQRCNDCDMLLVDEEECPYCGGELIDLPEDGDDEA